MKVFKKYFLGFICTVLNYSGRILESKIKNKNVFSIILKTEWQP